MAIFSRKDENDWTKKVMDYEVECVRPRGRPVKTWSEVVEKGCWRNNTGTEGVS